MEKGMSTHSSILAWRIPWTKKPGVSPWDHRESDMTERPKLSLFFFFGMKKKFKKKSKGRIRIMENITQGWRLPGGTSGKEPACQCKRHKRHRFDPGVRKISWSRKRQPTPAFLPGKFHNQRSFMSYRPWGHKESDTTEHTQCTRTRQQKRHWCIEQSYGLCGRGRGWEDLGEWHWNM